MAMEASGDLCEGGAEYGRDMAIERDLAAVGWPSREDYEQADEELGEGSLVPGLLAESAGVQSTAEPSSLFLSEALRDSHWEDECLAMNRGPPSNDWATFSPSYQPPNTNHWVQSTIPESTEEDPAIYGNHAVMDTSPGWQAFSLGGADSPTLSSKALTSTSVASSTLDTADRSPHNMCTTHCEGTGTEVSDVSATAVNVTPAPCAAVFRCCFYDGRQRDGQGERGVSEREGSHCLLVAAECASDWQHLKNDSFAELLWRWSQTSLHHPPPSSCQTALTSLILRGNPSLIESEYGGGVGGATQLQSEYVGGVGGAVALPIRDDEKFDWTPADQRRRSVSPEVVPNLFRPRKESLVDVDFDHDRAASGLAVLSEAELRRMCDEMTSKFSRLSSELLTCLQTRDVLAGEMEAKNRFVSALLRVQQLRLSQEVNGGLSEAGRGRQWVWSQKRKEDDASAAMYLQAIIPYKIPDGLMWKTDTLIQLTKILKAIAEGSSTVPKLMSDYLQSEFITSPITDRRHSFRDSLTPDQSTVLSNLSI